MAIDPMTALSIAKGVGGFIDARNKAREQEERYLANRQSAAQSRDLAVQQLNRRAIQEAEMATQQKLETSIRALELRESRKTIGGEAGLGGQTERLKIDKVTAQELRQETAINDRVKGTLQEIEMNKIGVNAKALQRINSMQRGVQPDLLMAGIGIASNAIASDMKYGSDVFGLGAKAAALGSGQVSFSPATSNVSNISSFDVNQ